MLNQCTLMGRLTRDPELRSIQNGDSVLSFTIAIPRDYVAPGAERETDFIDIVAWRKTAEFVARHFRKGSAILLSGSLQMRDWTAKDGTKRRNAEIVADQVWFADSKREEKKETFDAPPEDTEIPF